MSENQAGLYGLLQGAMELAEEAKEVYLESLDIKTVAEIRKLEAALQPMALYMLLCTLDNTIDVKDDDPAYFCTDYWSDMINDPAVIAGILADSKVETALDMIGWMNREENTAE